jgi:hypothetical protein
LPTRYQCSTASTQRGRPGLDATTTSIVAS